MEDQLKKWKEKYGEIYEIEAEDKKCWLRSPDRTIMGMALRYANTDPMKFNDVLIQNCFLGGDPAFKEDDALYLGLCGKLTEMVKTKEVTLKKI